MRKRDMQPVQEPAQMIRCAIYTRKSTTEGLEMDFNTLDAQREACEAYIKSQMHEGWVVIPEMYDDGGYSGGTIERPAFKQLMADIEDGQVDCVVVYKIDRFSRSLMDFTKIMDVFEKHNVSFVSITQQFNTGTSMGRLMMNVLLSFAQFERELVSERTRDKIAAARKKGKWAGGFPVMGYDIDHQAHRLVVNEEEAVQVREIFDLYLQKQTLLETVNELEQRGWKTKTWTTKNGKLNPGQPFNKNRLHRMLNNVAYLGKVPHKDQVYEGEHPALIDEETWRRVQHQLEFNLRTKRNNYKNKHGALLRGLVRCASCDCPMMHTFTNKKNRQYRYYTCTNAHNMGWKKCPTKSISAPRLEQAVVQQIKAFSKNPEIIEKTIETVNKQLKNRLPMLVSDKRRIQGEISQLREESKRLVAALAKAQGESSDIITERISDVEKSLADGHKRLSAVQDEMLKIDMETIDMKVIKKALQSFDPVWEVLYPRERIQVMNLLVEKVAYDGEAGNISISFHPMGLKAFAAQADNSKN